MDEDLRAIADRLLGIAEELAELALERLQAAMSQDDADAAEQERRITRARQAVQKAAALLGRDASDALGLP